MKHNKLSERDYIILKGRYNIQNLIRLYQYAEDPQRSLYIIMERRLFIHIIGHRTKPVVCFHCYYSLAKTYTFLVDNKKKAISSYTFEEQLQEANKAAGEISIRKVEIN